jgi:hypothetical protein
VDVKEEIDAIFSDLFYWVNPKRDLAAIIIILLEWTLV